MDFPFYSSLELWRYLSNSKIGFHSYKTRNGIPDKSGIYAWFLPLDIDGSLENVIVKNKKFFTYDASNKGNFRRDISDKFQWQGFDLTLEANTNYNRQTTIESKWQSLLDGMSHDESKSVRQLFSLGTIFSRPLYVGLTKNLSSRYDQHLVHTEKNSFSKRFIDSQSDVDSKRSMKELLFVSVTVDLGENEINDELILVLEYLLKNIVNPVYGER